MRWVERMAVDTTAAVVGMMTLTTEEAADTDHAVVAQGDPVPVVVTGR